MIIKTLPTLTATPLVSVLASAENGSTGSTEVWYGGEYDVVTGSEVTAYQLNVQNASLENPATFSSDTPSICSVNASGIVTKANAGSGVVTVANDFGSRRVSTPFSNGTVSSRVFTGFVSGSFADFTWQLLKTKLDAGGTLPLFTSGASLNPSGTFSETCWARAFDFSGVPCPFLNGQLTNNWGGALVTPQHVKGAWHYHGAIGTVMRFFSKTNPGHYEDRTVIGMTADDPAVPPSPYFFANNLQIGDTIILTLNAPVSADIIHYPLIGNYAYQLGAEYTNSGYGPDVVVAPAWVGGGQIYLNQFREALFGALSSANLTASYRILDSLVHGVTISNNYGALNAVATTDNLNAVFASYAGFTKNVISGDSGHPSFFPLSSTELGLWTTFTGGTYGPSNNELLINTCIISADDDAIARGNLASRTGYTVTVAPDPTL